MGANLPVRGVERGLAVRLPGPPGPTAVRRVGALLGSPLGEALLAAAPEVLRAVGRAGEPIRQPHAPPSGLSGRVSGATVSEVEVEMAEPGIRRVVIRTASTWSVSPPGAWATPVGRGSRWGRRLLAGALGAGGLALGLAARRVPGRSARGARVIPW